MSQEDRSEHDSEQTASQRLPVTTHAAALSVEIRTPLAQIELAASQLFREALTPNARTQSEQIFHAVSEIDELVERMLRVLVPPRRRQANSGDISLMLAQLRRRFVPALAACGVEWKLRDAAEEPVLGDVEAVRRQCTELLHLALILSGEGGQFTLVVDGRDDGVDASLFCRRASAFSEVEMESARNAVQRSQAVALEGGAELFGDLTALTCDVRLHIANQSEVEGLPPSLFEATRDLEAACRES